MCELTELEPRVHYVNGTASTALPNAGHRLIDELRSEFTRLRKARKMTQAGVAAHLGVRQATISAFELGKSGTMRKDHLDKIVELVQAWRGGHTRIIPFGFPETPASEPLSSDVDTLPPAATQAVDPVAKAFIVQAVADVLHSEQAALELTSSLTSEQLMRTFLLAQRLRETAP